jgi:hypothetical protein
MGTDTRNCQEQRVVDDDDDSKTSRGSPHNTTRTHVSPTAPPHPVGDSSGMMFAVVLLDNSFNSRMNECRYRNI